MRWMRSFLVMQVVVKSFPKIEKYFSKNWGVEFISLSHWIKSRINYIKNNVIWRINLSLLKMKKLEKNGKKIIIMAHNFCLEVNGQQQSEDEIKYTEFWSPNFNVFKKKNDFLLYSVQFSYSVMFDSLQPHELQHARPPCPSPTPGVYPNSSPLSRWCHPTISTSVIPFSSCLQSFPASGSFQISQLFTSRGQSIGVSTSNISPSNKHSGLISFRMDRLDLLAVQGTLKSLLQYHTSKASILQLSFL